MRKIIILNMLLICSVSYAQTYNSADSLTYISESDVLKQNLPKPVGVVNDYERILSPLQVAELTKIIEDYEKKTTNDIYIVTTDSISPYKEINDYAVALLTYWHIGKDDRENGIVIIVSLPLKKVFIGAKAGAHKVIGGTVSQNIIDEKILPACRDQKYFDGLKNGVLAIIDKWK
ncbi:MAG: TPM domain-containing protein [Bacteroidales bacterium]|nr:TPM domain-containing protein [Bacteroidales bacterium]